MGATSPLPLHFQALWSCTHSYPQSFTIELQRLSSWPYSPYDHPDSARCNLSQSSPCIALVSTWPPPLGLLEFVCESVMKTLCREVQPQLSKGCILRPCAQRRSMICSWKQRRRMEKGRKERTWRGRERRKRAGNEREASTGRKKEGRQHSSIFYL